MGIYKVQSNGKAPAGLVSGDQVVTAGGTYVITGVQADGSYNSIMYNAAQTTANYQGKYDIPASIYPNAGSPNTGSGAASGSNAGGSSAAAGSSFSLPSVSDYLAAGGKAEDYYMQLLGETLKNNYQPTQAANYQGISFDRAVELAGQSLTPQYSSAYRQAAQRSGQQLEKAGLYDTLYGQVLSAQAQGEVTQALGQAVYELALDLMNSSQSSADKQRAQDAAELQYSHKQSSQQQAQALDYLLKLIQSQQQQA